jgi:hypothetical protein
MLVLTWGVGAQPPPGDGLPSGPGGPIPVFGPPGMGQTRKILKDFDKDGDGRLNVEERKAARAFLKKDNANRGPGRMFRMGPPGFGAENQEPPKPGPRVAPNEVQTYPETVNLYEPTALRTLFLEFEEADWEAELEEFHGTDVEVPATLTVDGKKYPNVGIHFRGMSSYVGVRAGHKRSLNVAVDFADGKQRLLGYKTLNLLNSHEDPTFLSTVLFSHVARQYVPAPKANLVKVVINGQSWGVYVNAQQFNKEFTAEFFQSRKGARWKVRGNPGGGGGLDYVGDNVEAYRRHYELKSSEDPKAWQALIKLCKTLSQTPPDQLEAALAPMLDLDGALWFLALDIGLINCDGYWLRASDYSLYLDEKGKFHVIPHDMNECFRPAQGPGFGGPGGATFFVMPRPGEILPGPTQDRLQLTDEQKKQLAELQKEVDARLAKILNPGQNRQLKDMAGRGRDVVGPPGAFMIPLGGPGGPGGPRGGPGGPGGGVSNAGSGVEINPLAGLDDVRKPLRSKLLAVPSLRAKYLQNLRTLAEKSLDWKNLGPVVAQYRKLIEKEVEADTRKLDSFAEFQKLTADSPAAEPERSGRGPNLISLRAFADRRRKYLLEYQEPKTPPAPPAAGR